MSSGVQACPGGGTAGLRVRPNHFPGTFLGKEPSSTTQTVVGKNNHEHDLRFMFGVCRHKYYDFGNVHAGLILFSVENCIEIIVESHVVIRNSTERGVL